MSNSTLELLGQMAVVDGLLSPDEERLLREYADLCGIDCEEFISELKKQAEKIDTKVVSVNANFLKGIEFENFILNGLKSFPNLKIESRSADYKLGQCSWLDARSLEPDFLISHTLGRFNIRYWLECKYRSSMGTLSFRSVQIDRYMAAKDKEQLPVFIIFGTGGNPRCPEALFFFDIEDVIEGAVAHRTANGNYVINQMNLDKYRLNFLEFENVIKSFILT